MTEERSIGDWIAGIGGIIAFFAVWIAAVMSVGWVLGIALGWISAALAACLAAVILKWGWPVIALVIFLALLWLKTTHQI
jgi:hypothetical protein